MEGSKYQFILINFILIKGGFMVSLKGTKIALTRGDTFKMKLNLSDTSGESYTPKDGDVITFGVKKSYSDDECIIEKIIPNDTLTLHILPEDTKLMNFGDYVWDAQIKFANGDVYTFITKASLKIVEEVV